MFDDVNDNNTLYHTVLIDTTLNEIVIKPIDEYSCEYFYYMFCCCFVNTDNAYIYV